MAIKLIFSGRTKGAIRFGFNNRLVAYRIKSRKWFYCEDVGLWFEASKQDKEELNKALEHWFISCSDAEYKAAKIKLTPCLTK